MLGNKTQDNSHNCSLSNPGKYLTPFQRKLLQKSLQEDLSELYRQRIEIMLLADEGKTQAEICRLLACCQATARHWIMMASSGQGHNWKAQPIGRPNTVNDQYLERLKELVSNSPRDYGYPFKLWTAKWLSKHLAKEFGLQISDRHINRLLKQMGLSTRPKPKNTDKETTASGLLIRDLPAANTPDSSGIWPINLDKSREDIQIYGSSSIRSFSFSARAKQYFGALPYSQAIPTLS